MMIDGIRNRPKPSQTHFYQKDIIVQSPKMFLFGRVLDHLEPPEIRVAAIRESLYPTGPTRRRHATNLGGQRSIPRGEL